jgi:thiamine pyrophosphate-dependent acetolactate synthase large subunit-like protein
MPITLVLLNNNELGKISKEFLSDDKEVWHTSLFNPNFAEYAKNCGGEGIRVTKNEDLEEALKRGLASKKPAIVEIITDPLLI